MKTPIRTALLVLAGLATFLGAPDTLADWRGWEREYSELIVFGDSLSDPGNKFAVIGATNDGIWEAIPDEPYDSRRFSNGKTWVEHLARALRTYRGGLPAYRNDWFGNYAYAGARAQGMDGEAPSFGDQVKRYLASTGGVANPDALYVVQFGGNDIRDALNAAQTALLGGGSPAEAQQAAGLVIAGAVNALAEQMGRLRAAGAQNFLVANAPNLGRTPVVTALGASADAEFLSSVFNTGVDGIVAFYASTGANLYRLDLFNFVEAATEIPLGLGFVNSAEPCLQVFAPPATGVCNDADQRLFWDGIHPTRAAHRLIGSIAINVLSID